MTTTAKAIDWVKRAQSFAPRIEAARDETERARGVPSELIQDMAKAGFFRLKMPAAYGGAELDHATCFRVYEELALADASAAWVVMIGNEGAAMGGYLPAELAREIFGSDANVILAFSNFRRHAEATKEDGSYRVSGQWGYASGSPDATWFGGLLPLSVEDSGANGSEGKTEIYAVFMPKSECEVLDTWDALGLRGSASHDFSTRLTLVPKTRAVPWASLQPQLPGPLWCGPFTLHLGGMAGINLGIARVAIDELTALAGKVPNRGGPALGERGTVQSIIGRAEALVRSARAFLYDTLDEIYASQCMGNPPTAEQMTLKNLAVLHAAHSCAEAVDLAYTAAGTTSVTTDSRLERCFRDVHVSTQHQATSIYRYEELGRFFLESARSG